MTEMKNLLLPALLLLGISFMFVSCEKEGSKVDKDTIEGKWWIAERFSDCFNGEVVKDYSDFSNAKWEIERFRIEGGNITLVDRDGQQMVFPCSILDNAILVFNTPYFIVKQGKNELVLDYQFHSISLEYVLDDWNGYYMYKGKEIYTYFDYKVFWYYDDNGKPVECFCRYTDSRHNVYLEEWYDSERFYFKAE